MPPLVIIIGLGLSLVYVLVWGEGIWLPNRGSSNQSESQTFCLECWNVDSSLLGLSHKDGVPGTAATTKTEPGATLQPPKQKQILHMDPSDII